VNNPKIEINSGEILVDFDKLRKEGAVCLVGTDCPERKRRDDCRTRKAFEQAAR
jgi:hypothetical protein